MFKRNYLKALRTQKNYTFEDLSFHFGISRNHCISIEHGKRGSRLTLEMAKKLADAFDLTLDKFYLYESKYLSENNLVRPSIYD